jgi:Phycobilisome protein
MHTDLTNIYYKAETESLNSGDLKALNSHLTSLAKRLEAYHFIRDNETIIFQPIANELVAKYANTDQLILEQVLKHWLTILRYAAWGMLINNPEYLAKNILEWLIDIIKVQEIQEIETQLYQMLNSRLKDLLSEEKYALLKPFLTKAETTILAIN